jgi:hypothetical protein
MSSTNGRIVGHRGLHTVLLPEERIYCDPTVQHSRSFRTSDMLIIFFFRNLQVLFHRGGSSLSSWNCSMLV